MSLYTHMLTDVAQHEFFPVDIVPTTSRSAPECFYDSDTTELVQRTLFVSVVLYNIQSADQLQNTLKP